MNWNLVAIYLEYLYLGSEEYFKLHKTIPNFLRQENRKEYEFAMRVYLTIEITPE